MYEPLNTDCNMDNDTGWGISILIPKRKNKTEKACLFSELE